MAPDARHPGCKLACIPFEPLKHDGDALWYPASFALLNWYLREPPKIRRISAKSLPRYMRALLSEIEDFIGCSVIILDIKTDIGVATFAALPSSLDSFPGSIGSGASLDPTCALERSLTELSQAVQFARLDIDKTHQNRIANVREWPFLRKCALLDKSPFHSTQEESLEMGGSGPASKDIKTQVSEVANRLSGHGLESYYFSWNPEAPRLPVVTTLVPGMDWFAMVHSAAVALPTGRAMRLLQRLRPSIADAMLCGIFSACPRYASFSVR
jgi:ribosomal protein S12 methylthiotransferase accessory factor